MKMFSIGFLLAFLFLAGTHTYGKSTPEDLDKSAVDRVATFTQVWGLMKYYHPAVSAGTLNWDSVFVAYVPKVMDAQDKQEFNKLMDAFYAQIPSPKLALTYSLPKADTIVAVFSAKEIAKYNVSPALKLQLVNLFERHLPVKSKYITNKYKEYTLDHILFLEEPMAEVAFPEKEIRLLALAWHWNTINFFYPHKQTIGREWEAVLKQFIPAFEGAEIEMAYHLAIQRLNRELKDSHSFASSPTLNAMWGPNPYFRVRYIENRFVITEFDSDSVAKVQDIRKGDIITAINGRPVQECVKALKPLLAGSSEAATYRDIANYLLNVDAQKDVNLEIQRGNNRLTRKVSRFPYQDLVKLRDKAHQQLWRKLESDIMYVDYARIQKPDTLDALFEAIKDARVVILDLRGYPSFQVFQQTQPALYAENFHASHTSNALVDYPGFFSVSKSMYERTDTSALLPYTGSMIVVVDERSQSLTESFASELALRPNTLVMGTQTAGTTGNITWLKLPGGANIAFTGVGVKGVKSKFEQRKGVKIDKTVRPTVKSIVAGRDIVLEAAVAEARKQIIRATKYGGKLSSLN